MTAQKREILFFEDEFHSMVTEPLEPYLASLKVPVKFEAPTTNCWRGYQGTWKIENDRLFLTKLDAYVFGYRKVDINYLFPGEPVVFANWFTGEIKLQEGELLYYVHQGFESIYSFDLFLELENGKLLNTRLVGNVEEAMRRKKEDEDNQSIEDGPF